MIDVEPALDQLRVLFPDSQVDFGPKRTMRPRSGDLVLTLVPSGRSVAVLASPHRRVAAGALQRRSAADGVGVGMARDVVAGVLSVPGAHRLLPHVAVVSSPGDGSILEHLATAGVRPERVSLVVASSRANANAVLSVHRKDGRETAFVKVATTELSSALVAHEASSLEVLGQARLRRLLVPTVLSCTTWRGRPVLAMSVLPAARTPRRQAGPPLDAFLEVASVARAGPTVPGSTPWIARVRSRARRCYVPDAERLLAAVAVLCEAPELPLGASHGDWGPWNMAWGRDRPAVWDWERFSTGLPLGVDLVHYVAHRELARSESVVRARSILDSAERWLASAVPELVGSTSWVVDAYLLELAARLLHDATGHHGSAAAAELGRRYLDVLADRHPALRADELARSGRASHDRRNL